MYRGGFMRVSSWISCFTLLMLSAIGAALGQDTNFATGPQYLVIGSPIFARPISTPSLSLSGPALEVGASSATAGLAAGASIRTVPPPSADALPAVNFFPIYYGPPPASFIEISFSSSKASPGELPPSLLDTGVWQLTSAQILRERGYGVTLPEAAAYQKLQPRHASRVYTNADLDRLHGGS
jgi:hypothetical protein